MGRIKFTVILWYQRINPPWKLGIFLIYKKRNIIDYAVLMDKKKSERKGNDKQMLGSYQRAE